MENLALIPGTVGAAPIQNIGAYGLEVRDFIHSVEFIDLTTCFSGYLNNKECEFAYRDSVFKQDQSQARFITAVNFAIPKNYQAVVSYAPLDTLAEVTPQHIFDKVIETRRQKLPDPKTVGNAGSFFKNPVVNLAHYIKLQETYHDIPGYPLDGNKVKVPAAWLIDRLGFKGQQIEGIACHEKQALVLTNADQGSGLALLSLARKIKQAVAEAFAISLENEVQLIAKSGRITL